jgi:hypothetical protein
LIGDQFGAHVEPDRRGRGILVQAVILLSPSYLKPSQRLLSRKPRRPTQACASRYLRDDQLFRDDQLLCRSRARVMAKPWSARSGSPTRELPQRRVPSVQLKGQKNGLAHLKDHSVPQVDLDYSSPELWI